MYTIGQLAKATNVTVRALHYYDELGLLKPSAVTEAGYRCYTTDAIIKLQQILALKQLGFPLSQIKALVAEHPGGSDETRWKAALQMQLAAVRTEQQRLNDLERLLLTALNGLQITGKFDPDDIVLFIQSLQRDAHFQQQAWREQTFSVHEVHILNTLPSLDTDDPRTQRWVQLLRGVRDQLDEPPHSPKSQDLAQRILDCAADLFHGDEALMDKYWEIVKPVPGEPPQVYGLDAEVAEYIDTLLECYISSGKGSQHS